MCFGAAIGALAGATVAYLLYTDRGRGIRDRLEPAVDDLRREFMRFQRTIGKVSDLAGEGFRAVAEFKAARGQQRPH